VLGISQADVQELIRNKLAGVEDPEEDDDEFDDAVAAPVKRRGRRSSPNLNRPAKGGLTPRKRRKNSEAVVPVRKRRAKVQL
jgi:hypothetical protein